MRHLTFLLYLILALLFMRTESVCTAADTGSVTIPIMLHGTYLYVEVRINGKPATFVIDSGAGANIITPEAAKRLALSTSGTEATINGAAGAGGSASQAKIAALEIGSTSIENQNAYIFALPEILECDGLLGTPFLRSRVVTIDYQHRELTLTSIDDFKAPAGAATFRLLLQSNTPFVEASVSGHRGWFGIDTGAGSGITLFNAFVEKHHLHDEHSPVLRTPTGRAIGGLIYGELARVSEFSLGSSRWVRPVVEFSRQTEGAFADKDNAGNLGGEVWQRFTVTLDYTHEKLYLKPNSLKDKPFDTPRTGLALDTQNGVCTVIDVRPHSPAAEAGIVAGDTILTVNGQPLRKIKYWELTDLLRSSPGTKLQLRLMSVAKSEREVTITSRDLL